MAMEELVVLHCVVGLSLEGLGKKNRRRVSNVWKTVG